MAAWVVVPLKRLEDAKQRLIPRLPPAGRQALARDMLDHLLSVLAATPGLAGIAVVSPERLDLPPGIVTIPDPGGGLNAALRAAAQDITRRGGAKMLILPADLPCIEVADVTALLEAARTAPVVIAPDRHGQGTNALCLTPPGRIAPAFGPGSFARHQAAAGDVAVVARDNLAFDVDLPEDFEVWQSRRLMSRSSHPF